MTTSEATPRREPLPRVELATGRLVLRPWAEADIEQIFVICQDPEIQRWTTVPSPYKLSDASSFVRRIAPEGFASGTAATFGIFVKDSGRVAGAITIGDITLGSETGPSRSRQGEIGYWANPETRGRGYLTEATRELVRWSFDELGLQRIVWLAVDGNVASWRVVEKAGFRKVGTTRSSHVMRGQLVDMQVADMIPSDPRL